MSISDILWGYIGYLNFCEATHLSLTLCKWERGAPGNKEIIIGGAQFKTPHLPFMITGNNNSVSKLKYDRFRRPLHTWYQILVLLLCATTTKSSLSLTILIFILIMLKVVHYNIKCYERKNAQLVLAEKKKYDNMCKHY